MQTLAETDASRGTLVGGTWNRSGTILFSTRIIRRISAGGGAATSLTVLNRARNEISHSSPRFLPDGRHFVFFAQSSKSENRCLYIASLDSEPARILTAADSGAIYVDPGFLLFLKGETLEAQKFDVGKLELTGNEIPVVGNAGPLFDGSESGILIYRKGNIQTRYTGSFVWFDRAGKQVGQLADGNFGGMELSPDGARVVTDLADRALTGTPTPTVWIMDTTRLVTTRTIVQDAFGIRAPVWSPDGLRLAFQSTRPGGAPIIAVKPVSGPGEGQVLFEGTRNEALTTRQWTPDGRYILFLRQSNSPQTSALWAVPLFGDSKPFRVVNSIASETHGRVSPDGKWLAYATNETGKLQVVVEPFPNVSGAKSRKWQISADGGLDPKWRRDGHELYYLTLDAKLMAVPVKTDVKFEAGQPAFLFRTPVVIQGALPINRRYDVSSDGERFLMIAAPRATSSTPITLVLNWTSVLNK